MSTPAEPPDPDRTHTPDRLHLTLFISGASPTSARAVRRLRDLCERHASSGYDLRIVDIYLKDKEVTEPSKKEAEVKTGTNATSDNNKIKIDHDTLLSCQYYFC